MTKLKGDIFKAHSDKLGLLWTNDQWQTVMDAMEEYAQQEVKKMVKPAVMHCFDCKFLRKLKSGMDWCINDKSWLVGWITDAINQGCEHHAPKNSTYTPAPPSIQ